MPSLSTFLHPLNELLEGESKWKWTDSCHPLNELLEAESKWKWTDS